MKNYILLLSLLTIGLSLTGCQDVLQDIAPKQATAVADSKKVPDAYRAVNIDLLRVEVSGDNDDNSGTWAELPNVAPGLRNLLVTGEKATPLLTSAEFNTGSVKQLRLILGPNSTIVLNDGTVVALDTPSGEQSGLKVKVNASAIKGQTYAVLVSIDPNWQVVARGNGQFNLKPVLEGTLQAGNRHESEQ